MLGMDSRNLEYGSELVMDQASNQFVQETFNTNPEIFSAEINTESGIVQ